jgi:hypothetical protein
MRVLEENASIYDYNWSIILLVGSDIYTRVIKESGVTSNHCQKGNLRKSERNEARRDKRFTDSHRAREKMIEKYYGTEPTVVCTCSTRYRYRSKYWCQYRAHRTPKPLTPVGTNYVLKIESNEIGRSWL